MNATFKQPQLNNQKSSNLRTALFFLIDGNYGKWLKFVCTFLFLGSYS